jgi:hypothetical protein
LLASQPDRRTFRSHGRWLVRGLPQRIEGIVEGDARWASGGLREQGRHHPDRALEAVEPLPERREGNPELLVLARVPAGPEPEDEASAGDVVEHRGCLREDGRVTERVRGHRDADPQARDTACECGEQGHRLEACSPMLAVGVGEVIARPSGVEDTELARQRPRGYQTGPVDAGRVGGRDPKPEKPGTRSHGASRWTTSPPAAEVHPSTLRGQG